MDDTHGDLDAEHVQWMKNSSQINATTLSPYVIEYASHSCKLLISKNAICISTFRWVSCQTPQSMPEIWIG